MHLPDLLNRPPIPIPWQEGEKIPWNDPAFSQRMLQEHLSQQHDLASRRFSIIDAHVTWIHHHVLAQKPAQILDLGCGPGFYSNRLACLGHTCTGIDFSPASIAHARATAASQGTTSAFHLADLRAAEFGYGHDLVMFIFGELNVFTPAHTSLILNKAAAALRNGGQLLLEVTTYAGVKGIGTQPQHWSVLEKGLFSDKPHLLLNESVWNEAQKVAIERFYVMDLASGIVTVHAATSQAYRTAQWRALLKQAGFKSVKVLPSLTGTKDAVNDGLVVLLAQR